MIPSSFPCSCFGLSTEKLWIFKKPCVVITHWNLGGCNGAEQSTGEVMAFAVLCTSKIQKLSQAFTALNLA